ncbi:MAG: 4-alpha-glucanotransferase, partial [Prevotella sp.]|nr:4-alpha-glucanotransferase [Prevotella sp.]
MKLKFSINYHTAWGESLHVSIDFHSQDGTVRHQNLLMLTEDGELWTLETSALVGRQHPLSHIQYCYQVEDVDGQVLRKEWDMVPRIYYFDATKDYVFPDEWRDRPLPMHLYSAAYLTSQFSPLSSRVNPLRLPLFRRTILFRVSAPQLKKGQLMAVSGSHPAIGSWNTSRYLPMEYAGDGEWMLTVNAQGWLMPVEYKYVVVDANSHELVAWEEGDNRSVPVSSAEGSTNEIPDGQVLVLYGGHLRLAEETWRAAGVAVPVFSLRSEHSYGVGDFGDLRRFVDWAVATGMKFIQLLPVNDTTTDGRWHDSYPYNIVSMFALHPHYVDLEAAGTLRSKTQMTKFLRRRRELNALPYSDYELVDRVKSAYIHDLFEERGRQTLDSKAFKIWYQKNESWLVPYANWIAEQSEAELIYYIQYQLHVQLLEAADYARSKGIILKGDVPIGVNRHSVETESHPELFNMDSSTGAPPDTFSHNGQNWGFPTYNWQEEQDSRKKRHQVSLPEWFQLRMKWMEQYFDAFRIDHVLGFFRIWEIPQD